MEEEERRIVEEEVEEYKKRQEARKLCSVAARKYGLKGFQKEEFISHCSTSRITDPTILITQIYDDFMKTYRPKVEGEEFDDVAVVDTGPLESIKTAKRFREYAYALGKEGKLLINYTVLAELQKHRIIPEIVASDDLPISRITKRIRHRFNILSETDKQKLIQATKKNIVNLINQKLHRPALTIDNIEIIPYDRKTVEKIEKYVLEKKEDIGNLEAAKARKLIDEEVSLADLSLIATMVKSDIPLLIAADKHFLDNIAFWDEIIKKLVENKYRLKRKKPIEIDDLKIISQRTLGVKKR